jgi:NAD(P)-dependent dehydrogenase (short-subunit alcohol dehydrogenase family)
MELHGRTALITGASQGLGRAIAAGFVRAGASVLLTARNEALLRQVETELRRLVAGTAVAVHALAGNVSRPGDCAAVARRAREIFPGLDILVNNAGIYGPIGPLEDVDWGAWEEALRVNLFGTALMCREAIPLLRARGQGKIINLSGGGATAPLPRFSAYAAAKAGVVRLTETLAEELRSARIDVNAIAPGALNTRLLDQVLASGPDKAGKDFYERSLRQREEGGVPLERGVALAVLLAGTIGPSCPSAATSWPGAISIRCGGSSPKTGGRSGARRNCRLRPDRSQTGPDPGRMFAASDGRRRARAGPGPGRAVSRLHRQRRLAGTRGPRRHRPGHCFHNQ